MATIRAYRGEILASPATIHVQRAELTANPTGSAHVQVYRAELVAGGSASLGVDIVGQEPWTLVSLTATAPGTPTSWTYGQLSGTAVTLTAVGSAVSFIAPPSIQTDTITLTVVANYADGSMSGMGTIAIEVLFATEYVNILDAWVPCRVQTFDPVLP